MELTEMEAHDFGFDLGFEGQPLPDREGAEAMGYDPDRYADLYDGWRCGLEIARLMMEESN